MEESIKIIHDRLLVSMKAFHAFCEEHGIEYTLHGGSLLGAVRERGFIPWDDDVDLAMMRDQFEKLMAALEASEPKPFDIENTLENRTGTCTRLRLTGNKAPGPEAWLDIFICDYISEKRLAQRIKIRGSIFLNRLVRGGVKTDKKGINKILIAITCAIGAVIPKRAKNRLQLWFEKNALTGNRQYVYRSNDQYKGIILVLPVSTMQNFMLTQFEDTELKISSEYDAILRSSYGDNYMTPVKYTTGTELQHSHVNK